jgi:hypothetical protein
MKKIIKGLIALSVVAAAVSFGAASDRCHMLNGEAHYWGGQHAIAQVGSCTYDKVTMSTCPAIANHVFYQLSGGVGSKCANLHGTIYVSGCSEVHDEDILTGVTDHGANFTGNIYKNDASLHIRNMEHGMQMSALLIK